MHSAGQCCGVSHSGRKHSMACLGGGSEHICAGKLGYNVNLLVAACKAGCHPGQYIAVTAALCTLQPGTNRCVACSAAAHDDIGLLQHPLHLNAALGTLKHSCLQKRRPGANAWNSKVGSRRCQGHQGFRPPLPCAACSLPSTATVQLHPHNLRQKGPHTGSILP